MPVASLLFTSRSARTRFVSLLSVLLLMSGCAVNQQGLLAVRVIEADGAMVYDTRVAGLHLRSAAADRGLSLGYTRRICILDRRDSSPPSGWYFFQGPELPGECRAYDNNTLGLELRMAAPDTSLTLGARFTTQLARVRDGDATDFSLFFHRDRLDKTKLVIH